MSTRNNKASAELSSAEFVRQNDIYNEQIQPTETSFRYADLGLFFFFQLQNHSW